MKHRLYQYYKKIVMIAIIIGMVFPDCMPIVQVMAESFSDKTIPTLDATVNVTNASNTGSSGVTSVGRGEKIYMISKGNTARVQVTINPRELNKGESLEGVYSKIALGYFDDKNQLVYEPDTNVDNSSDGKARIYARVIDDGETWQDTQYRNEHPETGELTDRNKRITGNLRLDFSHDKVFKADEGTTSYSYVLEIGFVGPVQENAVFVLKTFVGYDLWQYKNSNQQQVSEPVDYISKETSASTAMLINSNLKWEFVAKQLTGEFQNNTAPTLWKRYNYQDILLTFKNISENEDPYFEQFEATFRLPFDNGLNGVLDSEMIQWVYDKDDPDNPKQNPNINEKPDKDTLYVGKRNEGGLLIYDVTDLDKTVWQDVNSRNKRLPKVAKSIPYSYVGAGQGNVLIDIEHGGTLYSPLAVEKDDTGKKKSERSLLIRIPLQNNFFFLNNSDYVFCQTKITPTIQFGTPVVSISRLESNVLQYFKKQKISGLTIKEAQKDKMYIGKEAYYTLTAKNTSNINVYNPVIEDELPEWFDLTKFQYTVTKDEVEDLNTFELKEVFDTKVPLEFAFLDNRVNEVKWVSIGTWEEIAEKEIVGEDGQIQEKTKRTWQIANVQQWLKSYLEKNKDEEFTRKIRFHYSYNFDEKDPDETGLGIDETILGQLKLCGVPKKAVTLTNKAKLYVDYYSYQEASNTSDRGWFHSQRQPHKTSVDKVVEPIALWSETLGLFDDGRKRIEKNPANGAVNSDINGYTVRFGINNSSDLYKGKVTMKIPATWDNHNYNGFKTKQIKFRKELFERAKVTSVTLKLWFKEYKIIENRPSGYYERFHAVPPTSVTIPVADLEKFKVKREEEKKEEETDNTEEKPPIYDYVLTEKDWRKYLPSSVVWNRDGHDKPDVTIPYEVIVNFDLLKSDTVKVTPITDDPAYIEYLGSYPYPGRIELKTRIESLYNDKIQKEVAHESVGQLDFLVPDLQPVVDGVYDDGVEHLEADPVKGALNRPFGGYRMKMKVARASLAPGFAKLELPKTFNGHEVKIDKDLLDSMTIVDGNPTYQNIVFKGTNGSYVELSKEELDTLYNQNTGEVVIPKERWETIVDKETNTNIWQETEQLKEVILYFELLKETETGKTHSGSMYVYGTVTRVGDSKAIGTLSSNYPKESKVAQVVKMDPGVIHVNPPAVYLNVQALDIENLRREEKELITGLSYKNCVGYTYRFGSSNETPIEPGELYITLPTVRGDYPHFDASEILLTKEFLSQIQINKIRVEGFSKTGTTEEVVWEKEKLQELGISSEIRDYDTDCRIPFTKWSGKAKAIVITFDTYKTDAEAGEDFPKQDAYIQVLGTAYKEKTWMVDKEGKGYWQYLDTVATLKTLYPPIGLTKDDNVSLTQSASLIIEPILPQVVSMAHNEQERMTGAKRNNPNQIPVQHDKNIQVPIDWNTYYTHDITNQSEYSIIRNGQISIALNNEIRDSSGKPYGFKPTKLWISKEDTKFFLQGVDKGIVDIKLLDTVPTGAEEKSATFSLTEWKEDDAGYWLEEKAWQEKQIVYPKEMILSVQYVSKKQTGTDVDLPKQNLLLKVYGQTDWYTYRGEPVKNNKAPMSEWEKLKSKGIFHIDTVLDKHTAYDMATQDVPIPKVLLSVDYNPYYEHTQGKEHQLSETLEQADAVGYVVEKDEANGDNGIRSYLAVPYEKTVTKRFSLWQDSISTADEFLAKIEIPMETNKEKGEEKRGFHTTWLSVSSRLFDETKADFLNFKMYLTDTYDKEIEVVGILNTDKTAFILTSKDGKKTKTIPLQTNTITKDRTEIPVGDLLLTREQLEEFGIKALKEVIVTGDDFLTSNKNIAGDIFVTGFSDSDFSVLLSPSKSLISYTIWYPPNKPPVEVGPEANEVGGGGYNDITKTKSDTYLRGQKDKKREEKLYTRFIDEGRLLISKMYFDLQVETGFLTEKSAKEYPEIRYLQKGISKEHIRETIISGSKKESGYFKYYDVRKLQAMYKGLVSIGVDFRQYNHDYIKGKPYMPDDVPNGHYGGDYAPERLARETPFDFDSKRYVKSYAYNTKTDVMVKVKLPVEKGYEPYYLKIDPRAVVGTNGQKYIDKIVFTRKNGTSFTVSGEQIEQNNNTSSWKRLPTDRGNDHTWYRINLLTTDDSKRFFTENDYHKVIATNPYYRDPVEEMDTDQAVCEAEFYLKMNQNDTHDGIHAAEPDFGTWVKDGEKGKTVDMADQHMFEFVGRANQVQKDLETVATAELTIGERIIETVGNVKNPQRTTKKSEEEYEEDYKNEKKSPWSLVNYYKNYYYSGNMQVYYEFKEYTAADLRSKAYFDVVETFLDGKNGIRKSLYQEKTLVDKKNQKLDYLYGSERPYNMTMLRKPYYWYPSGGTYHTLEPFIDKGTMIDTLPPLSRIDTGDYSGFKPTYYTIKDDLLDHVARVEFYVSDYSKEIQKDKTEVIVEPTLEKIATITKDDISSYSLIEDDLNETKKANYYKIPIHYEDDGASPTAQVLVIPKNKRLAQVKIVVENLVGNGDYASDTFGHSNDTYFNDTNQILWKAYGKICVLKGEEKHEEDGTNKVNVITENKGGSTFDKGVYLAQMKAFKIPLKIGTYTSRLARKENIETINGKTFNWDNGERWDYELTRNTAGTQVARVPMEMEFGIDIENYGKTNLKTDEGDTYSEASAKTICFTQPLPDKFRLTKIKIPKVLVDNTRSVVDFIQLTQKETLDKKKSGKEKEEPKVLQSYEITDTSTLQQDGEFYIVDLTKLFQDGTLKRTDVTYPDKYLVENKDKVFSAEQLTEFTIQFTLKDKLAAGEMLYGNDKYSNTGRLERTLEDRDIVFAGIWVDRTLEDIQTDEWNDNSIPTVGVRNPYGCRVLEEDLTLLSPTNLKTLTEEFGVADTTHWKDYGLTFAVKNRIAVIDGKQNRGTYIPLQNGTSHATMGYDDYERIPTQTWTPVSGVELYPGDIVEHKLTFYGNGGVAELPVKNPSMRFVAPKGARIIGWKFHSMNENYGYQDVGTSEKIVSGNDIEAFAYTTVDSNDKIPMENGVFYEERDGTETNYKELWLHTKKDRYLSKSGNLSVIIYLEMLDEYEDESFEGQITEQKAQFGSEYRHNYSCYYFRGRGCTSWGEYPDAIWGATAHAVAYSRNYEGTEDFLHKDGAVQRAVTVTSKLKYYEHKTKPTLMFQYKNTEGEKIDGQEVDLLVKYIYNAPKHFQNEMVEEVNFVKQSGKGVGKQYFTLSKYPEIFYPVSSTKAGESGVIEENGAFYKEAEIYYTTEVVTGGAVVTEWKPLSKQATKEELEKITRLKWIYKDVPAYLNNDGRTMVYMKDIRLEGTAHWQDEREDIHIPHTTNSCLMPAYLDETYLHIHESVPQQRVQLETINEVLEVIWRKRPKVETAVFAFDTKEDALLPFVRGNADPQRLKKGYRPEETFYYKIVVDNKKEKTNLGTGDLLSPIVYDKVPIQYVDMATTSAISVYDVDEQGNYTELSDLVNQYNVISHTAIEARDIGGSQFFEYRKDYDTKPSPVDIEHNPTFSPEDQGKEMVEYRLYTYDFSKIQYDLQRGHRLEIIYPVTAHKTGLPLARWIDKEGVVDGRNVYLPRYGEYASSLWEYDTSIGFVKNKMMDLDLLIHDIGVTGVRNEHTDPLEFLQGTRVHLPSNGNSGAFFEGIMNSKDRSLGVVAMDREGQDAQQVNEQTIYIKQKSQKNSVSDTATTLELEEKGLICGTAVFAKLGWFLELMKERIVNIASNLELDWKSKVEAKEPTNVIWSEHTLHLQKAWLSGATEFVSHEKDGKYYDVNYDIEKRTYKEVCSSASADHYYFTWAKTDQTTPAIEWQQNFTSRLYALNYGDYDANGIEMLYVFPKGIRPKFEEDGSLNLTGYVYNGKIIENNNKSYGTKEMAPVVEWNPMNATVVSQAALTVSNSAIQTMDMVQSQATITYEIVQKPEMNTVALPSSSLVDRRRNETGETRYELEEVDKDCWAIRIVVSEPLKKWWNRGSEEGYIFAIDVPSYVYENSAKGEWYDRLYVAPIDIKDNAYYQIYDTNYQLKKDYRVSYGRDYALYDNGKEHFDLDTGGMNGYYCLKHGGNNCYNYFLVPNIYLVAPPMHYVNGLNVQPNRVEKVSDPFILQEKNHFAQENNDTRLYAQVGNKAKVRKPFIRYWADTGVRDTGDNLDEKNFYVETEVETFPLNLNIENRYYGSELITYTSNSYGSHGKFRSNYSYQVEDGGARGTLFDPVITVVLPYGMMPINKDGDMYSEQLNDIPTNGINGTSDTLSWKIGTRQWQDAEFKIPGTQRSVSHTEKPNAIGKLVEQNQRLIKDAFDVKVDFDASTKQYSIQFIPKPHTDEEAIRLFNEQIMQVTIDMMCYDYNPNTLDGLNKGDWDDIYVYLGSQQPYFRYCADNELSTEERVKENPFHVLGVQPWKYYLLADPRFDAVRYISKSKYGRLEVRDDEDYMRRFKTKQFSYTETGLASEESTRVVPTNWKKKNYVEMNERLSWKDDTKYPRSEHNLFVEHVGVGNTLRLSPKNPLLTTTSKIGKERNEDGILWKETGKNIRVENLCYSDDVWYSVRVANERPENQQDQGIYDIRTGKYRTKAEFTGSIKHGTFTVTTYLPKELRYDDTLMRAEDDKYAEYFIESYDKDSVLIETLDKAELDAAGWKVEIKSIGFNEEGKQIVRAFVVPKGVEGTTPVNQFKPSMRAKGQLRSGESFVLHFKARVAEIDEPWDGRENWVIDTPTEMYTNVHGMDGGEVTFDRTMDIAGILEEKGIYSKQPWQLITYLNRLKAEPIREDNDQFDYDQDRVREERYSYDKTVGFTVVQPISYVRTNTEKVRRVFPPEPITGEIPSRDAIFKQAQRQELLINEARLAKGSVQKFAVQYDVPYRSQLAFPTDAEKDVRPQINPDVYAISTGVWELPKVVKHKEELEENLRVFVYLRERDEKESYFSIKEDDPDKEEDPEHSTNWKLLNPEGAKLYENVRIECRENVSQVLWLIKHKDDPIHYPVPSGFRLDIDADESEDGKQEVNEVDPPNDYIQEGYHKEEFAQNVKENSMRISAQTLLNEYKEKIQLLNYIVTSWSRYTDTKNELIGDSAYRTGYEVAPELPYMDLSEYTKYLEYQKGNGGSYSWTKNLIYDLSYSKIIKHKIAFHNVSQGLLDLHKPGAEEDVSTNPNIVVALPFRENIVKEDMVYVPFEKKQVKTNIASDEVNVQRFMLPRARDYVPTVIEHENVLSHSAILWKDAPWQTSIMREKATRETNSIPTEDALEDEFITSDKQLVSNLESSLYWTAYVEDELGNKYPLKELNGERTEDNIDVALAEDVTFSEGQVDSGVARRLLLFNFDGKLQAGQKIVVEYMSKISRDLVMGDSSDFQVKVWGAKEGNFIAALLPVVVEKADGSEEIEPSQNGLRIDRLDINQNSQTNELLLELASLFGTIKGNPNKRIQKYVASDLNPLSFQSSTPVPVTEGGKYHFRSKVSSIDTDGEPSFMAPVLFDILPYEGDSKIVAQKTQDQYVAEPRGSKWSGWLIPETVAVYTRSRNKISAPMTVKKVEQDKYDLFVGPIKKTEHGYELQVDENGRPKVPSLEARSESPFYKSINDLGKFSSELENFVNLQELLDGKQTISNYEDLIHGIRMILVKFKDPKNTILYGQGYYELQYSMKAPLNLPMYAGEYDEQNTKDYLGWNTMAGAIVPYSVGSLDDLTYDIPESNKVGIYINAPSNRGYIGDYVWYDYNADGIQNEAEYNRLFNGGSRHLHSKNTQDFNGDGIPDDPGINGVKVELLTVNGYPCNKNGQAVVPISNVAGYEGKEDCYFIIDETTGRYKMHDEKVRMTTEEGPVVMMTETDCEGSNGYYMLTDIKAGDYKLRFTMPKEYGSFELTTQTMYDKSIQVIKAGETLPKLNTEIPVEGNGQTANALTLITDTITIQSVDLSSDAAFKAYDTYATKGDIGVGKAVRYGGTIWNDAMDGAKPEQKLNGIRDQNAGNTKKPEKGIENVIVSVYEKGQTEVAKGMDGRELITKTDKDGNYLFETLWPNKEYVIRIDELTVTDSLGNDTTYRATPKQPNYKEPLKADEDNDGENKQDSTHYYVETGSFKTEYPRDEHGNLLVDEKDPNKVKANTSIDIGLVVPKEGAIGNYVWIDKNHNGIQDEDELPYREGLEIALESWYYNPIKKQWTTLNVPDLNTKSDELGAYVFLNLASTCEKYFDEQGNEVDQATEGATLRRCIVGYRPYVVHLPAEYMRTKIRQGDDPDKDSDLFDSGYLVEDGEYLVVATKDLQETPSENSIPVRMVINGMETTSYYLSQGSEYHMEYDIGLVKENSGGFFGKVWEDSNRNGLQDRGSEPAIQGVKVILERLKENELDSGVEPPMGETEQPWIPAGKKTVNDKYFVETDQVAKEKETVWIEPSLETDGIYETVQKVVIDKDGNETKVPMEVLTDEQGNYSFENIPLYDKVQNADGTVTKKPIRYRIRIEKPWNTQITTYQKEDRTHSTKDSDFALKKEHGKKEPFTLVTESFVLGKKMDQLDRWGNLYDYTENNYRSNIDAGLIVTPKLVEIGDYVWMDKNQNGIQDEEEYGIPEIEIQLFRFNPDVKSYVFEYDAAQTLYLKEIEGKWENVTNPDHSIVTTKTDQNGRYQFHVKAYVDDEHSSHYLEPYHYRMMAIYKGEGTLSELHIGTDRSVDSDGYLLGQLKTVEFTPNGQHTSTVASQGAIYLEEHPEYVEQLKDKEKLSPFDTPVGMIFGIPNVEGGIISDEFQIVSAMEQEITEEKPVNPQEVLSMILEWKEEGKVIEDAKEARCVLVTQSAITLTQNSSVVTTTQSAIVLEQEALQDSVSSTLETMLRSIKEDQLLTKGMILKDRRTRQIVDLYSLHGDDTMDIGIYDPTILPPDGGTPPDGGKTPEDGGTPPEEEEEIPPEEEIVPPEGEKVPPEKEKNPPDKSKKPSDKAKNPPDKGKKPSNKGKNPSNQGNTPKDKDVGYGQKGRHPSFGLEFNSKQKNKVNYDRYNQWISLYGRPKTGDVMPVVLMWCFLGLSSWFVVAHIRKRKKKK